MRVCRFRSFATNAWAPRIAALAKCACVALGCQAGSAAPITDPASQWPRWISDTGLDPSGADDAYSGGLAYDVGHALWTGEHDKTRVLALPDDAVIDGRDREHWRFPAGTVALKTIATWRGPIETRGIRALPDDAWEYVGYRWLPDGSDAERLDLATAEPIAGAAHEIPSERQCRQCHESAPVPLLGLRELQLALAPSDAGNELDRFDAIGLLAHAAPSHPPAIDQGDPVATRVLGWLLGNCVHCHNGGTQPNASFDLSPGVAFANLIGQPTRSSASGVGIRVVPGAPDASALVAAIEGIDDDAVLDAIDPMPPVGSVRRDERAIADVRTWIEGLPP